MKTFKSRSWRRGDASQLKVRRPQVRDNRVGTEIGERAGRTSGLCRPKAGQRYLRVAPPEEFHASEDAGRPASALHKVTSCSGKQT